MSKQKLKIAVGVNDRTLPLLAGLVDIPGATSEFLTAPLEEIFARAFDEQAYDVTELSFSNYLYLTATEQSPYIGLPVFPSRSFHCGRQINFPFVSPKYFPLRSLKQKTLLWIKCRKNYIIYI